MEKQVKKKCPLIELFNLASKQTVTYNCNKCDYIATDRNPTAAYKMYDKLLVPMLTVSAMKEYLMHYRREGDTTDLVISCLSAHVLVASMRNDRLT